MRIKTLVTSRMAPPKRDQRKKRAGKEKAKEIEIPVPRKQVFPAMGSYLKKSTVTEDDLRKLHEAGWMQDKITLLWSAPLPSQNIPLVPVDHTLMFSLFIERGLGLPVCSFYLCTFLRSFPWNSAAFQSVSRSFSCETNPKEKRLQSRRWRWIQTASVSQAEVHRVRSEGEQPWMEGSVVVCG